MITTSKIYISRSALKNNLEFIHQNLPEKTKLSAVVKGNAYGHGIESYTPLAQELGVDHFSTFSTDEAFRVFNSIDNSKADIMIMGGVFDEHLEWIIKNNIEFYVFNISTLNSTNEITKKLKKTARIHIEFETGMNRSGFHPNQLNRILSIFEENKYMKLEGICTHLAGAESISNFKRIQKQLKRFKNIKEKVDGHHQLEPKYHSLCSAGFLNYPRYKADMVRLGILQYGFFPNDETYVRFITKKKIMENPLQRLISWKSRVMDTKHVKTGEFVGYGTSYFTNAPTQIALIPVGYSHGFTRHLSNNGKVLIRGQRHAVIGMVNMNMLVVNVSSLDNIEVGDEVVFIGKQGDSELSVASFSDLSSLVNYELLTRLPNEINRKIID